MLKESKEFNPDLLYDWIKIEISHQVLKELEYFNCKSCVKEKTSIVPIKDEKTYKQAIKLNFDEADASIISKGKQDLDSIIVSEDGLLLEYARIKNLTAIQLIDLFLILMQKKLINSTQLYLLTKFLRHLKNITKKKEKAILKRRSSME
ncbi:MAG: hypothetical protein EAX96_14625 [Candidatus Lokiarchaeota archaeon]|nr:hypothetical protein [Candidatus Lokiarchaeota archaeon]